MTNRQNKANLSSNYSAASCPADTQTSIHTNTNSTFHEGLWYLSVFLWAFYFGSEICNRAHTRTFIRMYAPALKGNPRPLNWHLSVTLASCTDRSITRDGERRSVSGEKTEEGEAWKLKTKRRERREMKRRRRSKWRWDFWSLLETRRDESGAACCLVF